MTDMTMERYSDNQLKQRIELNRSAKFGLQSATPEQLNVVFMLARRYQLDPLTDITLFQGTPWYTINAALRVMRRHPEYAGFRQWPLNEQDKVDGGWNKDDIVWATEVRTKSWGNIVQWGKVTRAEVEQAFSRAERSEKQAAPIALHPVEIAQKRSAQHAIRAAFGYEAAPDEEEIQQIVAEEMARRADPERRKQLAAKHQEIFERFEPKDDDAARVEVWDRERPTPEEAAAAARAAAQIEADVVADAEVDEPDANTDALQLSNAWQRNRRLTDMATQLNVKARTLNVRASLAEIQAANDALEQALARAQAPR